MTDNLILTVYNGTPNKIYTSFLASVKDGEDPVQITTDSSNKWQPPVITPAQDCICDSNGIYQCNVRSKTEVMIPVVSLSDGKTYPASTIYFSFSPGYAGGKDGTFDSIPVTTPYTEGDDHPYIIQETVKCKSNPVLAIVLFIVAVLALVLTVAGLVLHKPALWIPGIVLFVIGLSGGAWSISSHK